ncbi:MAG: hypothetical protein NWS01_12235 [Burkholderiales bacterium]|nr:hypothetical protein [Burkholderiales bacterium]
MKTISKIIISITVLLSLTGCLYGQCMDGPCAFERAEIIANIKPYGAHWIKEGMTRESRRFDFVQCGASEDLRDGYTEWFSSVPYEVYSKGKGQHIRALADCMKTKGYLSLDQCDASCLYP